MAVKVTDVNGQSRCYSLGELMDEPATANTTKEIVLQVPVDKWPLTLEGLLEWAEIVSQDER